MSAQFASIVTASLAHQIAESLRQAILDGEVKVDERLPAEEELAERFGVSRPTIREALKRFERERILEHGLKMEEGRVSCSHQGHVSPSTWRWGDRDCASGDAQGLGQLAQPRPASISTAEPTSNSFRRSAARTICGHS